MPEAVEVAAMGGDACPAGKESHISSVVALTCFEIESVSVSTPSSKLSNRFGGVVPARSACLLGDGEAPSLASDGVGVHAAGGVPTASTAGTGSVAAVRGRTLRVA
jgi:hypothetical protein